MNNLKVDFKKSGGLVPAVITDYVTGQVLMVGYMNQYALEQTIDTGKVTFFSRSRQRLWMKGETSGNFLYVKNITGDCDSDALLISAVPKGSVCHTGSFSCFKNRRESDSFIGELSRLIKSRRKEMPEGSYTTSLFEAGTDRIAQKVGEEAIETVIAAMKNDKEELINETSDLIYHLLVLLTEMGIDWSDIQTNLYNRHD